MAQHHISRERTSSTKSHDNLNLANFRRDIIQMPCNMYRTLQIQYCNFFVHIQEQPFQVLGLIQQPLSCRLCLLHQQQSNNICSIRHLLTDLILEAVLDL